MTSPPSFRSWLAERANVATFVALAIIVVLAGVARIAPLPNEPLWLDELHTSWSVVAGIADVAPRARLGNQSPLYFYLPWLTTHVLGPSEFTLRLPSLVAGLALVPLVFAAAWRLAGSRLAGLTAALLVALDQDCIFFAQEARPYALVQVLAVINALCFWHMLGAPSLKIRAAWILTGALLFYTHYTAALILVAEGVYLSGLVMAIAICSRCSNENVKKPSESVNGRITRQVVLHKLLSFSLDATILVMVCLPATPYLAELARRKGNWQSFISAPDWTEVGEILPYYPLLIIPALIAGLAAMVRMFFRRAEASRELQMRALVFLATWAIIPVMVITLSTWTDIAPLFHRRYVIGSLAAVALFGVSAITLLSSQRERLAGFALVVTVALAFNGRFLESIGNGGEGAPFRQQEWHKAIEFVNQSALPREHVFVYSDLLESAVYMDDPDPLKREYCLLPVGGLYQLNENLRVRPADNERHFRTYRYTHGFTFWTKGDVEPALGFNASEFDPKLPVRKVGVDFEGEIEQDQTICWVITSSLTKEWLFSNDGLGPLPGNQNYKGSSPIDIYDFGEVHVIRMRRVVSKPDPDVVRSPFYGRDTIINVAPLPGSEKDDH